MSGGILRFPWTSQPQTIEPLNSAIGINDWTCLHVFGKPIRGTAGTVGTLINTARYAPGQGGIALDIVAAGDYLSYSGTGLALGVQSGVMLVEVTSLANVTTFFCTSITGGGNGFAVLMDGSGFCNLSKHNVANFCTSSVKMRLGLNAIAWSYNNSTGRAKLAVNGVVTSATSTQTFTHNGAGLGRYRASDTVNSFAHKQYLFAQSPSEIFGDGLLADLTKLPQSVWQIFQPIQRTIWVPAAAGGAFTPSITEAINLADTASQVASLSAAITEAATLSHSQDAIVGYAVSATETLNLSHSQTNVANFPATITEAMTLADSGSVQFGATSTISEAMTLADSSSNVAALSASITESMTLADSPNASASGDYTATQTEAMSLADTASNVAALSASITEPMSLSDSQSNVASLSASISESMTLADTASSSAAGDYTATITEAVTLSDSSSNIATLSATITESAALADTSTASSPGNFAASISESLALAEIASNQAALSAAMVEALSLADNAAAAWSRVVALTEAMTLSDSASQALNAIVTESVWWSYSVDPQDLHYSVDPQDLTFSIATLALAGR